MDPVRMKRDQGLGLGIVLVPARYSNGQIQRSDGSEARDPTDPARKLTDPARKPTDPVRKPTDPARSTTNPARTKRDQGLGLGIVLVSASGGSRGHRRARRREEVGGRRFDGPMGARPEIRRIQRGRSEIKG